MGMFKTPQKGVPSQLYDPHWFGLANIYLDQQYKLIDQYSNPQKKCSLTLLTLKFIVS